MNLGDLTVLWISFNDRFKCPGHGKSPIDSLHSFPRKVVSEKVFDDDIRDANDLVAACNRKESAMRLERTNLFQRFFYNIDSLPQVQWVPVVKRTNQFSLQKCRMIRSKSSLISNLHKFLTFDADDLFKDIVTRKNAYFFQWSYARAKNALKVVLS